MIHTYNFDDILLWSHQVNYPTGDSRTTASVAWHGFARQAGSTGTIDSKWNDFEPELKWDHVIQFSNVFFKC